MSNIAQFTVTTETSPATELSGTGGGFIVENLGPETIYLFNGYGQDPTFSATTWFALFAGKTLTFNGNTGGINLLAATVGGSSQVNVIETP